MEDCNKAVCQMRFPQKLWYLINQYTNSILWGHTRKTILLNYVILHDYLRSAGSIFKTSNISSFVRQLNLYGFRKVTSHLQDPLCNSSNPFMHEYIHEYFQFDRPELLNKIVRKHLVLKKNSKDVNLCQVICYPTLSNPLQKARRAFRLALKAAAQDLYLPQPSYNSEPQDSGEDDEFIDISSLTLPPRNPTNNLLDPKFPSSNKASTNSTLVPTDDIFNKEKRIEMFNIKIEPLNMTNFDESNSSQEYLSMPELDPDPIHTLDDGVELLAQFHVKNDKELTNNFKKDRIDFMSRNCVLPSISSFHNDDAVEENKSQFSPEEWEQLFNDIENRIPTQDVSNRSNLKDIYSEISKTIDILNV